MARRRSHAPSWRCLGAGVTRLFYARLDGPPVPQARARVAKTGHAYYPKTSVAYRAALIEQMTLHAPVGMHGRRWARKWSPAIVSVPCRIDIGVAGARANSDLDNYAKMALDALQDAGVLASDDVRTVQALRVECVDGEPRMEVTIWSA